MLQNPYIILERQLGKIISKIQGLCFALRLLLVDFLPISCSLHNSIIYMVSLFGSMSTFEALWKGNISFEKGHMRDMEINVSNGLLQKDRYWRLLPFPIYALFHMECSLPRVLQKCSLTPVRVLYSLWNCTNYIKLAEYQEKVWETKHKLSVFGIVIPSWVSKIT